MSALLGGAPAPAAYGQLSPNRAGGHAHKVYAKLGIISRAELGQLDLKDDDPDRQRLPGRSPGCLRSRQVKCGRGGVATTRFLIAREGAPGAAKRGGVTSTQGMTVPETGTLLLALLCSF